LPPVKGRYGSTQNPASFYRSCSAYVSLELRHEVLHLEDFIVKVRKV